jgi:hypothetical protein
MKNSLSSLLLIRWYNSQSLVTRRMLRRYIGPRGYSFVRLQVIDNQDVTSIQKENNPR